MSFQSHFTGDISEQNSVGRLNASGRSLSDRIAVLDTRAPGPLASRLKWLKVEGFTGTKGDGIINLHGFDIKTDKHTNTLRILLINHRPPFHPITGEPLDAYQVGANSTIEQFQTVAGGESMQHVRTYSNDIIDTPNSVHWVNDHAFIFTNDHSSKVGLVGTQVTTENRLTIFSDELLILYSEVVVLVIVTEVDATLPNLLELRSPTPMA